MGGTTGSILTGPDLMRDLASGKVFQPSPLHNQPPVPPAEECPSSCRRAGRNRACIGRANLFHCYTSEALIMADIFFKCTACGQNLLIEETGVGLTYDCLHCGHQMVVPPPGDEVECENCRQTLKVARGMEGESVRCPHCGGTVTVPTEDRPRVKLKSESAPPPLPTAMPAATPSECPSCHAPVMADAVICIQCGLNLKTGQKHATATASAGRTTNRAAQEARAKLIKNLVLVAVVVGIFAFAIPRLWDVFFPPRPQYAQQPLPVTKNKPVTSPAKPPTKMPMLPPMPGPMPPPMAPKLPAPSTNARPAAATPVVARPPMPPGPPLPMLPPMPPPNVAPPAATAKVVTPPKPPPAPVKPPSPLLTAEDLQKLGPLKTLTVDGITYENVRWTRVSPWEAFFFHQGGAASVLITKLLPALKEQYHYAPPKHE